MVLWVWLVLVCALMTTRAGALAEVQLARANKAEAAGSVAVWSVVSPLQQPC